MYGHLVRSLRAFAGAMLAQVAAGASVTVAELELREAGGATPTPAELAAVTQVLDDVRGNARRLGLASGGPA